MSRVKCQANVSSIHRNKARERVLDEGYLVESFVSNCTDTGLVVNGYRENTQYKSVGCEYRPYRCLDGAFNNAHLTHLPKARNVIYYGGGESSAALSPKLQMFALHNTSL